MEFSVGGDLSLFANQEEVDKLAPKLRATLFEQCTIAKMGELDPEFRAMLLEMHPSIDDDGFMIFLEEADMDLANEVISETQRKANNARRSKRRNYVEMSNSAGYYTPADISEIMSTQNYLCYFTGQKIDTEKKNWELDHLKPVSKGGSSWPGNLAILTKTTNQDKKDLTKQQYWDALEKRNGKEWAHKRKAVANEIDKKRKKIHQDRVHAFKVDLMKIASTLESEFPKHMVELRMDKDVIYMSVDDATIRFPKGLPRKRNCFKSADYFLELARLLAI